MTAQPTREADPADVFAERILQAIDEGQRTPTYKLLRSVRLADVPTP